VQLAQSRFSVSSNLNIEVIGACAKYVLKKLLRDETAPDRLATLNARTMEAVALLLWSSSTELVMAVEVWTHCGSSRLRCQGRVLKIFGKSLPAGACANSRSTNVRLETATMQKLCSAVRTIFWVRRSYL
jgi:hypothetical protein